MLKLAAPLAAIALVWTATSAQAADFRKFDQGNFEQMQTEGLSLIHI